MSDFLEKVKYLYSKLQPSDRREFLEFANRFESESFEKNQDERRVLEEKAYSLGPIASVSSSGVCPLCKK